MRTFAFALGVSMVTAAPAAFADGTAWLPTSSVTRQPEAGSSLITRNGMSVTLGLGAMNFVNKSARNLTSGDVGLYGDLRAAFGTRSYLGVEAAYTLSGRGLSADFSGDDPALFGHSVEGLLRFNYPMQSGRLFYAPFAVAGLGWTAFMRTDEVGTGDDKNLELHSSDHVGTIPVGAGFAMSLGRFYGEGRVMYRPTYGEDGIGAPSGGETNLQAWFAGVAAGLEF
ncbi:MAG TPA: hypothetical protein VGG33_09550 [Polyangia bacterium]